MSAIPVSLRGTEIPIRRVRFRDPTDIPGQSVTDGCDHGGQMNARRYEIALVPQLRQYVIALVCPGLPVTVCYVHESQVKTAYPLL